MENLEKDFFELFQSIFKAYGLSDLCVKVTSLLYLEPEEVSMEDLVKKTGYSLASISNTMKLLENAGMVQRVRKPKTKKIFFYMEKNLIKINMSKLKVAHDNSIKPAKEYLPQIIAKYKNKVKCEDDKKKLKIVENYLKQVTMFEGVLNKWQEDLTRISNEYQK